MYVIIYSREPLPAFVDARAEVAAVLALGCDVLVALEKGREVCDTELVVWCVGVVRREERTVCATGEEEGHVGGCVVARRRDGCAVSWRFAKLILSNVIVRDGVSADDANTSRYQDAPELCNLESSCRREAAADRVA